MALKNFCSLTFSFPWRMEHRLSGYNWFESRHDQNIFSIVRLKDGVTIPQVQAELTAIAAREAASIRKTKKS